MVPVALLASMASARRMLGGNIDSALTAAVAPTVVLKNFLLDASNVIGLPVLVIDVKCA
ncbi:hypothetical protein D3C87_1438500 [compost metagenome]